MPSHTRGERACIPLNTHMDALFDRQIERLTDEASQSRMFQKALMALFPVPITTRPDTRQSSRGQLGRSSNAKTARNSKM